jgi:hypothetical protein
MRAEALVGSDSEPEVQGTTQHTSFEENMYPEELVTYKRRRKRLVGMDPGSQAIQSELQHDDLSDDEHAPEVEEFPVIEM